MRLFRLTRPDYAPGLDGTGAMRAGGRWNSPGLPAVYCAGSVSLAALEVFVHLPPSMRRPEKLPRLVIVSLDLPDEIDMHIGAEAALPDRPSIEDYRAIGDQWIGQGRAPVLKVPSLVIPCEYNFVLNPEHPGTAAVTVLGIDDFRFDPRMGG